MDELGNLENLLNELLKGIQDVIQSGEILTDEFQGILAQELEYLTSRIDELRAQESPVEGLQPTVAPEMQQSMPSSNISRFRYDPKQQKLFVQFLGKHPNPNGPIYSYDGVPQQIFDLFQKGAVPARSDGKNKWGKWWKGKVPSMGASMYTLLKTAAYPYQRLS